VGNRVEYDAFISYSHAADGRLAPAIQNGLQRLAKPWHQRRSLRVFRDETGLSVNPHLWESIVEALDDSRWFIVLASPESAESVWVNRELEHFLATRPDAHERLLPVVTDGTWEWDELANGFTSSTDCVPPALADAFASEPRHLDLSWARTEQQLHLRRADFRSAIADIAAPIHGIAKDELESEDIRNFRRGRLLRRGAVAALATLAVGLGVATVAALNSRQQARDLADDLTTTNESLDTTNEQLESTNVELADTNTALESSLVAEQAARDEAEQRAIESRSRELAARSLNTVDTDPHLAALLGVQAMYPSGVGSDAATTDARAALGVATRALTNPALTRASDPIDGSLVWSANTPNRAGRLLVGGDDGRLQVWDSGTLGFGRADDPEPVFALEAPEWWSADLSPDGTRLMVVDDSAVRSYDVDAGSLSWEISGFGPDLSYVTDHSDDGVVVAVTGRDGTVVLDARDGTVIARFDAGADGFVEPQLIDLGTDGSRLAMAGDGNPDDRSDGRTDTIQVIDVATGRIASQGNIDEQLVGLRWFGDDHLVLVDQDGSVSTWWVSESQRGFGAAVGSRGQSFAAWSPSRDRLALLDQTGRLTMLRIEFPSNVFVDSTIDLPIVARGLTWIGDAELAVDDPGRPGVIVYADPQQDVVSAAAADGSIIVRDREVIDVDTETTLWTLPPNASEPVVSPTGAYVAAEQYTESDHFVEIRDGWTGELLSSVPVTSYGTHGFLGDGDRFISWNGPGVRVWSVADGALLVDTSAPDGPDAEAYGLLAYDPEGDRAIGLADEVTLAVLDLHTGETRLLPSFQREITGIGWTTDPGSALVGLFDQTVRVIDVDDGTTVETFRGLAAAPQAMAMSADGTRLVAATSETAMFWDLTTGTPLDTIAVSEQTLGIVANSDGSGFWHKGLTRWRYWPDVDPLLACELALPAAETDFERLIGEASVCAELLG